MRKRRYRAFRGKRRKPFRDARFVSASNSLPVASHSELNRTKLDSKGRSRLIESRVNIGSYTKLLFPDLTAFFFLKHCPFDCTEEKPMSAFLLQSVCQPPLIRFNDLPLKFYRLFPLHSRDLEVPRKSLITTWASLEAESEWNEFESDKSSQPWTAVAAEN